MLGLAWFLAQLTLSSFADSSVAPLVTESWMLSQEASVFAESLVRPCLSGPSSQVTTGGSRIIVRDTAACVSQLQVFSHYWESQRGTELATVHVANSEQREKYTTLILQHPLLETKVLPMLQACSCLALSGANAQYAAAYVVNPQGAVGSLGARVRPTPYY